MLLIECPHCKGTCIIEEIACGIFRHGVYKQTLTQIPPHAPKEMCDALVAQDQIYGCGKPFQLIYELTEYQATPCEYI